MLAAAVLLAVAGTWGVKTRMQPAHTWAQRADAAQSAMTELYWSDKRQMFNNAYPCLLDLCNDKFHYWWQAHGIDATVDALVRTGDEAYRRRLDAYYDGMLLRNGGHLLNDYYDDMEWLALAYLRAYDATKDEKFLAAAQTLWTDIKTGWNDEQGGGIAWRKSQLDYKNTPANAPAAILAARLYKRLGRPDDLEWALKIYRWQKAHLVDPETGFVWDGKNREGNGLIDKGWEFTYCQGVFIGAGVELYRATGDRTYLDDAVRTARAAGDRLFSPVTGVVQTEGKNDQEGDAGLFKGIFFRYLGELALEAPGHGDLLKVNAERLWTEGRAPDKALFSLSFTRAPESSVSLSVQLSGVMLTEQMAVLEKRGLLGK